MADLKLKVALQPHGHTEALRLGKIKPKGIELEQIDVKPLNYIYRRMIRDEEFDIAEMAMSTFLCALDFKKPMIGLPVLSNRGFFTNGVAYRTAAGIEEPKDLEGKRVGLSAYTMTHTAQGRGMLRNEYGVDTHNVEWVVLDDDHVAEYQPPANVTRKSGKTLEELLKAGEIDAILGSGLEEGDLRQLISTADAKQRQADSYKRTGVWPIGHTVALKSSAVEANPWIVEELFNAFAASKQIYLEELRSGKAPVARDRETAEAMSLVGPDPMPFGIPPNRKSLEAAIDLDFEEKIISRRMTVEELFAPNSLELVG